jgi:uncharacterized protein (TIGR03000 family)
MLPRTSSLVRAAVLTMAGGILGWSAAPQARAQTASQAAFGEGFRREGMFAPAGTATTSSTTDNGMWPGVFEVVCPAGCYGAAFHVFGRRAFGGAGYYGPLRRYWGYGSYGPNYNMGPVGPQYGAGCPMLYAATYRGHKFFKHGGGDCYPAGMEFGSAPAGAGGNPAGQPAVGKGSPPAEERPAPAPNAAHLQLLVPENAEVLVDGGKTTTTGAIRDFVSPPLDPGKNMRYTIVVRYKDADGKTVEESHVVRFRANDRLRIDCTKPANPMQTAVVKSPG